MTNGTCYLSRIAQYSKILDLLAIYSSSIFFNEDLRKRFTLSTVPLAHGAPTATSLCLMLLADKDLENSSDCEVNAVLRSETIMQGLPKILKSDEKCFNVSLEVIDLTGNNHVNLENASIMTKMCLNHRPRL